MIMGRTMMKIFLTKKMISSLQADKQIRIRRKKNEMVPKSKLIIKRISRIMPESYGSQSK